MAKKSTGNDPGGNARVPSTSVRVNGGDIDSAARGFDNDSYERGYPSIANSDMHINRPGSGKSKGN